MTLTGYKTIEEVNAIIREEVEDTGFEVTSGDGWGIVGIKAKNLNVFTETDVETNFDMEDAVGCFIGKVSFRASINNMGGNPTPEELEDAGFEIVEMARMIARLNAMNLEFAKVVTGK